jgi:hypothetical protein
MNIEAAAPDASNPNPGQGDDAAKGEANVPQDGTADAPKPPEGQGDKPADATNSEAKEGEKPADAKPTGAPEKYELAMPEGFTLDEAAMGQFEPVLRELNLSNEQANKLAGIYAGLLKGQADNHATLVEGWGKALKEDPEFGGAGFDANLGQAAKNIAELGGQPMIDLLDQFGFGNNPVLNKYALANAKRIASLEQELRKYTGEPADMPGSGTQGASKSITERMYANHR